MKFFKKVMKGCLSLLFIFLCCHCWGQESSDRFIQSPNAASLGFYGKTDVSFFTGLLDIAIPVIKLRYRDIELPISLKYNSGGVLLEQHPSWVGQNWTLNVGEVITRKIKYFLNRRQLISESVAFINHYKNIINIIIL